MTPVGGKQGDGGDAVMGMTRWWGWQGYRVRVRMMAGVTGVMGVTGFRGVTGVTGVTRWCEWQGWQGDRDRGDASRLTWRQGWQGEQYKGIKWEILLDHDGNIRTVTDSNRWKWLWKILLTMHDAALKSWPGTSGIDNGGWQLRILLERRGMSETFHTEKVFDECRKCKVMTVLVW